MAPWPEGCWQKGLGLCSASKVHGSRGGHFGGWPDHGVCPWQARVGWQWAGSVGGERAHHQNQTSCPFFVVYSEKDRQEVNTFDQYTRPGSHVLFE